MNRIQLTIDGKTITVDAGTTILAAARAADIYIPSLCSHPDMPPAKKTTPATWVFQGDRQIRNHRPGEPVGGCGLCVVQVAGMADLVAACATEAAEGMVVETANDRVRARRRENLIPILARHRHACLTCAQQEGCSRSQCSSNVPESERCCSRFGHCELQDVVNHVGISDDTPQWRPTDLPVLADGPLFNRDYNLCIGCLRCVRACGDLRGVGALGFVWDADGAMQVGMVAMGPADAGCRFCTACVAVCPTGALTDKALRSGKKEGDLVPCRAACPVNLDVPGYLRLIAQGRPEAAHAVIREKVPFPGILGRICIHPCEDACRRGEVNDAVAICALKRFASEADLPHPTEVARVKPDTGKQVAVVGAGPAGLTAAFYLRKQGHAVTVYDRAGEAGGMLRYGIPRYRLPAAVLEREIEAVWSLGVKFVPNHILGRDISLARLRQNGARAVFLAVGAPGSRRIPLTGADLPDVLRGVDFLRESASAAAIDLKENVVVIGGGNVAVDVAMTALRRGAANVFIACLESEAEMPAGRREIDTARAEGIRILPSVGPERVVVENGRVTGLDLVSCTCVFDGKGNFCPRFDESSRECLLVDQIILAVGQQTELSFIAGQDPIRVKNGLIVVDEHSLQTGMPGIYAGGDVAAMPGAVIHAVAAGRRAAESIDRALGGSGDIGETFFDRPAPAARLGNTPGFSDWPRETMPVRSPQTRRADFGEIAIGLGADQARREAQRCLQCDLRLAIGCNPRPPVHLLAFDATNASAAPAAEGVYQLLDGERNIISIKGTDNLRLSLLAALEDNSTASFFEFEEDKMFSTRESELIQKYLQEHGRMPGGGEDELDDLYGF